MLPIPLTDVPAAGRPAPAAALRAALRRVDLEMVGLAAVLLAALAAIQAAAPGLVAGDDGYYHVKMAALMRADLTPAFVWLPETILNPRDYADHHWLFHVLLIPFTFGDLVRGGQAAAVAFGAAALVTAAWVLRRHGVPAAPAWALAILASPGFAYRLSMPRAQSLSLLWLFVAVHLLLARRERWLVAVAFTYVWLYDAFPLLLVVAAVYVLAARAVEGEWRWRAVAYPTAGTALGLVVNPYFPRNVVFLFHHLVAKLDIERVPVGVEWDPYTTAGLVENAWPALVAVAAGAWALGWRRERMGVAAAFGLGLCVVFGAMQLVSRRFVEYFPPMAVLFCALAWAPILAGRPVRRGVAVALGLVLAAALAWSVHDTREAVRGITPATALRGPALWLAANSPPGAVVFQTDWDDFPRLFFYNTHNVFTVGLDPTFLERWDRDRYLEWVDLSRGRGRDLSTAIRRDLGAAYVVSDLAHRAFLERAAKDPQLVEVYRDASGVVYKVHE